MQRILEEDLEHEEESKLSLKGFIKMQKALNISEQASRSKGQGLTKRTRELKKMAHKNKGVEHIIHQIETCIRYSVGSHVHFVGHNWKTNLTYLNLV